MSNTEIKNFSGNSAIPTSIAPWLSVPEIVKAIDFYTSAFEAMEVYRLEAPDGSLQVVRLSVEGAEFWLSQGSDDNNTTAEPAAETAIRMILTVADPDFIFDKALQAGATQVFPVGEEYGWRLGRLIDPSGHHWEIGRPVSQ